MVIPSLSSGLSTLLPTATQTSRPGLAANQDSRGLKLGRYMRNEAAATGTTPPSGTSDTFAAEIMRRLQSAQTASNAGALAASGAAGDLQSALADTIDYVREQHGDAAATAVMGIVVKGVGQGTGGEDALGDALVSALKFIDRNFGISSGDAAMAQFNGSLNDAVNGYFQNGKSELFHASESSASGGSEVQGILAATLSTVSDTFGTDAATAISDILTQSLKETGVSRQGLGQALAKADEYLKNNSETSDGLLDLTTQAGAATTLAKGTVLDLAV